MNRQTNFLAANGRLALVALAMGLGLFTGLVSAAAQDAAEIGKLQNEVRENYFAAKYKEAMEAAKKLHELQPSDADTVYNIACLHCLMGEKDEAYTWLEKAVAAGYRDADHMMQDKDFRTIRGEDRFRKIVADLRSENDDEADEPARDEEKPKEKPKEKSKSDDDDMTVQERQRRINDLTGALIQTAGEKDYDEALEIALEAERLAQKDMNAPTKALTAYNVACMHSLMKNKDKAIEAFERAAKSGGFSEDLVEQMKRDSDLDYIRKDPRFKEIAGELIEGMAEKVEPGTKVTLPKKFDKSEPAPLIVALHPWGGNMEETRDRWLKVADRMGAILLTPQGTLRMDDDEYRWDQNLDMVEDQVMQAVESVMDQYKIDEDKVVIAGFSQGGWAAYAIALRNPGTINGVIAIGGKFDKSFEAEADGEDLEDLRVVIMVGEKDEDEILESNRLAEKVLKKCGAKVQYKSYKGLGHDFPKDADKELAAAVDYILE